MSEAMSSDPPFTHWTGSMPQLNLNEPASTSRQNSTDQLDDAESLLLEGFGGDSSEDIENILGDEMISHFEECLREGEMGAPVLETNTGSNSLNVPTTSAFNSVPTLQNPPVSLRLNRLCAKTSFSEPNSKIASYLARIPFRHASFFRNDQKLLTLDFSYNPELNVGLHLRKFDYFQLFNNQAKLTTKIKSLASLLKFELEEEHDYFLLRNVDTVIQICMDHRGTITNCLTSWYGAHLRVNDRLKSLLQQNKWLSVMRLLKTMSGLIPACVPMNERINCLNGLIILEHDLSLLFKEDMLAMSIYGKSNVEVYRQRTDLTPFTIAIHWETLKSSDLHVNETPQFDSPQSDSLCAYLSVAYNEYSTLFPTSSCLNNNLQWVEMTGTHVPAMMSELLELDSSIYTIRPVNWLFELASNRFSAQSLSFVGKDSKNESHRYIFANSMLGEQDVYLVRRITFNSPKTIVGLIMKLRRQASFVGLVKNLFEQFAHKKQLPYREHLVAKIGSESPTSLIIQFNNDRIDIGTVTINTKNSGFDVGICMSNGQVIEQPKLQEWNVLLNRIWSIPTLMHKIIIDLKRMRNQIHSVQFGQTEETSTIILNGPKLKLFEYLQESSIIKRLSKKQQRRVEQQKKMSENVLNESSTEQKDRLRKASEITRFRNQHSSFLSQYFLRSNNVYPIKFSTALKSTSMPVARLRAIMTALSSNCRLRAIISSKKDLSRVPRFVVGDKTPTVLPSMAQLAKIEQRRRALKRLKCRRSRNPDSDQKSSKNPKKPNILKSSTKASKTVCLNPVIQTVDTSNENDRITTVPNSDAQPTNSILNQKKKQSVHMNRFTLAKKIVRRRATTGKRFFGILSGWKKFYAHTFKILTEPKQRLTFEEDINLEQGSLLSSQSENQIDPNLYPVPNPLSPGYFKRMNSHLSSFSTNTFFNYNSFGTQSNYNPNPSLSNIYPNSNIVFNQPTLPLHLGHKRSIDMKGFPGDSSSNSNRVEADTKHSIMSELAIRRKRNTNAVIAAGMEIEMENEDAFEESDEECDPPPMPKSSQQQSIDARRKRDQEVRNQRQEKINKMVMERQKQAQKQEEDREKKEKAAMARTEEEKRKRQQQTTSGVSSRPPTRTLSNAGPIPNFSGYDHQIKGEFFEQEAEFDQKAESLSIKFPRSFADQRISTDTERGTRRPRKELRRTLSVSSTGSNHSVSSSDSTQKFRRKTFSKGSSAEKRSKYSTESKEHKLSRTKEESTSRGKSVSGKEVPVKRSSSASSSSSTTGSSSTGSSYSDCPPMLTGRLQRQNSAMMDSMHQDDESRQSTKSNSSIPHLALAAGDSGQNWQMKSEKDDGSNRTSNAHAYHNYPFEPEDGTRNEDDCGETPSSLLPGSSKRLEFDKERKLSKERNKKERKTEDSGTESDKQRQFESERGKVFKPTGKAIKSIDKIADRLKEKEKAQKLKIEKEKKMKEKTGRLQPLPDVFDVPIPDAKILKRKRDISIKPQPSSSSSLKEQEKFKSKEFRDAKDLKAPKRPTKTSLLQEIPGAPIQTRKRSPLPRHKEEQQPKKPRVSTDPEFKLSASSSDKPRSGKSSKPEDSRGLKRTISATLEERRRKVRKVVVDDKPKEPETSNKKKPTNIFQDLPEFTGRPCLSNLKNFKIPKVVDTDTTKTAEKEESEKEAEKNKEPREAPPPIYKETRNEAHVERRDPPPHVDTSYERRPEPSSHFPNETGQREFFADRGRSNYYGRGGKFHHGNYLPGSNQPYRGHYDGSPVYNERGGSFRRQRGGKLGSLSYDDRSRNPQHFMAPPHHKKSLTEFGDSRPGSSQRRPYARERSGPAAPWSNNYYPDEQGEYTSMMSSANNAYSAAYNTSLHHPFQSPSDELDKDFRPPYSEGGEDSPDALQIDENV